jgi:predicted AAA+ superfamily ATPase
VKNTALIGALSDKTFAQILSEPKEWGRVLESAIGSHLLNYSQGNQYEVYYWRHRNEEVDFVIKKGKKIIALEVKSGNTKATSGMRAFKNKFNPYKVLLIGTKGFLWQDFLRINPVDLFE